MKKVFIYLLVDPRKPETVRYVGQTGTPLSRHIQHCCESGQSAKCQWIESIRLEGVMPQMITVEETIETDANDKERIWINRFTSQSLTNRESVTAQNQKPQNRTHAAPADCAQVAPTNALKTMNDAERDLIIQMLASCHGNKLEASKRLGIGRQTLYNKLKLYGLEKTFKKVAPAELI